MMNTVLKIVFTPMTPFIKHPELAYLVAAGFVILWAVSVWHSGKFRQRWHVFMLLPTLLWVLYGLHETQAKMAGWNIRIDLMVIIPVLYAASATSVWLGIRELAARKSSEPNAAKTPEGS